MRLFSLYMRSCPSCVCSESPFVDHASGLLLVSLLNFNISDFKLKSWVFKRKVCSQRFSCEAAQTCTCSQTWACAWAAGYTTRRNYELVVLVLFLFTTFLTVYYQDVFLLVTISYVFDKPFVPCLHETACVYLLFISWPSRVQSLHPPFFSFFFSSFPLFSFRTRKRSL